MNYGIKITKPWSKEMYDHNEMVSEVMKSEIINQIKKNQNNYDKLNELMVLCGGIKYGDGYSIEELFEDCLNEVDNVQNYWLNEEFPYAVSQGLVNDINLNFIGYDK
mgnify:FL=1